MEKQTTPPKWLDQLMSSICKKEVFEILQGDLHEIYRRNARAFGIRKANILYFRDVLTTLRPNLMKEMEGNLQLNPYGILKNHVKISARNIKRNALFSTINIVGLAISMSLGILMIMFLSDLQSVDGFHTHKKDIYRITTTRPGLFGDKIDHLASSSYYIGDQVEAQVPEVQQLTVISWRIKADLGTTEKRVPYSGFYVTPSFFDVLTFPLIHGNPQTALARPGSIVLTESSARRLFGDHDPLGQQVEIFGQNDFKQGIVTAIAKDPPHNSYLDFEMLFSMEDHALITSDFRNNPMNTFENHVYLQLRSDANPEVVEDKISTIINNHPANTFGVTHGLEAMSQFVTGADMNALGPRFSQKKVNMMLILTLFVILSACFNYANLTIGRSFQRIKEIGIRKVTGASRTQLFEQFIIESLLASMIALILGVGLFFIMRPIALEQFNFIIKNESIIRLEINLFHWLLFLLFAFTTGIVAGLFPAVILSRAKSSWLLNETGKVKLISGVSARKVLITCQFTMSIGLIICAVSAYKQYAYTLNYELGYNTDNILNVTVHSDYMDLLSQEYQSLSEVSATTSSELVLGTRSGLIGSGISEDFSDTVMFTRNAIGSNYLSFHDFQLLAGSLIFSKKEEGRGTIIINEQMMKALNIDAPEKAIGKMVRLQDRNKTIVSIQGVVKDFVGMSLDFQMPEPFVFLPRNSEQPGTLGVKIRTQDILATMTQLEEIYRKYDPVHPFQARFYEDQLASTYKGLQSNFTLIAFLAFLAISISTLGLIGMGAYLTESRLKEISIRKVMGADTNNLILLLSKGFSVMVIIATLVAIPLSVQIIDKYILQSFFYRAQVGFWELSSGFFVLLIIGLVSVGFQIRKVLKMNPSDLLRTE